jgi:copper transport protein
MVRRSIQMIAALLLALIGVFGGATPASAHAIIVRSEPADGSSLAAAPEHVRLWFSEPVALTFTTLELVDGDGRRIPVQAHSDAASLALAVRSGEAGGAVLVVVDLPKLAPNAYRLNWRTISNSDLHSTAGTLVFGVQRSVDTAAPAFASAPAPLEVALRWLNLAALATLLGALALALLTTLDAGRTALDERAATDNGSHRPSAIHTAQRLLQLARWSALLALLVGAALMLAQVRAASSATDQSMVATLWQIVAGTSYGISWLLRQGILLVLILNIMILVRIAATRHAPRIAHAAARGIAAGLLVALAVAQALQSHANAFGDLSIIRVFADALHLLAAGLWAGGLLALVVVVVPLLRRGPDAAALAWTILRRFGALAAASLAALLVTGLFMSGQQVASLDALLTTFYGRLLLLKVGLAAGVALIGLRNAATLHPYVARIVRQLLRRQQRVAPFAGRHLARTVALEASGGLALLLLAATLSATQPARGPEFDLPDETPPASVTMNADDLVITLAVKPNRPGRNFVALGVFNTRRPAPAPITHVAVRMLPPAGQSSFGPVDAEALDNGHYQIAGDMINAAGDWRILISVVRPGLPDTTATLPWTVLPLAAQPRPVLVSNRPLAPTLTLAAAIVALLLGIALILFWARRRVALRLHIRPGANDDSPLTERVA